MVPSFTRTQCRFSLVTPSGHRDSQQGGVATPPFPPSTFTSTEHRSELVAHDLRFRNYHPKDVEFNLPELTNLIMLKVSFHSSFYVLVNECLTAYEACMAAFRHLDPGQPHKRFLATIRPHKPVRSTTLATCLIQALTQPSLGVILLGVLHLPLPLGLGFQ